MRIFRIASLLFYTALFASVTPSTSSAADVAVIPVASNIDSPVAVTAAGDNSGRLFILERSGRVLLQRGNVQPEPFLDIRSRVSCCGERGLLGIAFHPEFATNGTFYVNYTNLQFDTIIAEYQVSPDPDRADVNSESILLNIPQPFSNHNGGQLAFGPDGYLYIGTGDGGSGGDPNNFAQSGLSLLGKVLRLAVNPGQPYSIPNSNPFVSNSSFRDEIWATGLRNPYRFSFDRLTGDLLIADVGQNAIEEVNIQPAGSTGGLNYGWRAMEGSRCFNPVSGCESDDFTLPAFEYENAGARCSIIGGYRYRGSAMRALQGSYIYGDFCSGEIFAARLNNNQEWVQEVLLDTNFMISSFGEDDSGELLVLDLAGTVYRLTAPLAISPASGTYLSSQSIDLALIISAQNAVVSSYSAALNGQDVTIDLDGCSIPGTVNGGGTSLRCPGIPLTILGPGTHIFHVKMQLADGSILSDTVTWQVLQAAE